MTDYYRYDRHLIDGLKRITSFVKIKQLKFTRDLYWIRSE